jgi:predicted MFS family arabinose efflux permease
MVYQRPFRPEEKKPELGLRGEVVGLNITAGVLSWFQVTATEITAQHHVIATGETQRGNQYPLPQANFRIGDIVQAGADAVIYSDKQGQVVRLERTGQTALLFATHDATPDGQPRIVPWELGIDALGRTYFVDLEGRSVRRIDSPQNAPVVLDQAIIAAGRGEATPVFNYYRLSVIPDGMLLTCNDEAVVVRDAAGAINYYTTAAFSLLEQGIHWMAWGVTGWLITLLLWGSWLIYIEIVGRVMPPLLARASGIVGIIVVAAVLSAQPLIERFSTQHRHLVIEKIKEIITLAPDALDTEHFSNINNLSDFGNSDYMALRNTLTAMFVNNDANWSEGYYFALYRVSNERLYGFMYMNAQIGMFHPFDWLDTGSVYDQALAGKVAAEAVTDVTGSWIYGVGPIKDKDGNVVALIESGTDLYIFQLENEELIREMVVNLTTMLIVLILVLVEVAYMVDVLKQRAMRHRKSSIISDVLLVRPLSFLFFSSVAVSVSFIPLMMKRLYQPVPGLSMEMVLALPLSLELFGLGMASILGSILVARFGWKMVFYVGADLAVTGLLLSGGADSMQLLGIARLLTGIGSGLVFFALRSLVNSEHDIIIRNQGFSHFYSGMTAGTAVGAVFGGALAERIGYSPVFLVSALFVVIVVVFQLIFLKQPSIAKSNTALHLAPRLGMGQALRLLITDPHNLALFLLIVFPAYIAAAFTFYYFPLFAESQGLSTGTIGLFIIFGSLCVIYLGPVLTNYIGRSVGSHRGMFIGTIFCGGGLILFGLLGDLPWAVLAIITMGIAEGFSVPAQNDVFLQSKVALEAGEDQAISYYDLLGNLGEMLGPLAFAAAITISTLSGPLFIGCIIMSFGVLFFFITRHHATTPAAGATT